MRAVIPIFTLALTMASPALAQSAGEQLFLSRCAGCHGAGAQGDGPMAGLITVEVPDLTGLVARNGGAFPLADVVRTIDGRMALRGHGGGPMPVFGEILGGGSAALDLPDGAILETRGDVLAIAAYLQEIQQ